MEYRSRAVAKPLTVDESVALTAAVEGINRTLRELHLAGHDFGVAVIGNEAIPPVVMPDARPRHMRITPPRVYVKLTEAAVEVGREPSR